MKKTFLFLLILVLFFSCKKNSTNGKIDPLLTGRWIWVYNGMGNSVFNNQNSGVKKTLVFKSDGSLIVIHNDSILNINLLEVQSTSPVVLFPSLVTDSLSYSIISQDAGCVDIKFPFLKITNGYGYQYTVTSDSLIISPDPCLAPFINVYAKQQ